MTKGSLGNMGIVKGPVMLQRGSEFGGAVEAGRAQQFGNAVIKALDHAVGLRPARRDDPVFDTTRGAGSVETMVAGGLTLALRGQAVGDFLAVVCKKLLDLDGTGGDQPIEKPLHDRSGRVEQDLEIDPPGGPVDSDG